MYVHSIFKSISGEVSGCGQGMTTAFIRLQGCQLRCKFCDTPETQQIEIGPYLELDEILFKIYQLRTKNIIITGGEPLLQHEKLSILCDELMSRDYNISIETNGGLPIGVLPPGNISYVVDYKLQLPDKMLSFSEFALLQKKDFIKFVISTFNELDKAIWLQKKLLEMGCKAKFAYSPMIDGEVKQKDRTFCKHIYNALDQNHLEGIINLQLHKFLNFK